MAGEGRPSAYWGRPAESNETFAAYLADGCGPFLRTGDLGFLHGSELFITGRLKDLIVVRGVNHYPQDMEETVQSTCSEVASHGVAAIGVELEGREAIVLLLEIRKKELAGVSFDDIAQSVRSAIAINHEVGIEEVVFVKRGALPRTSSGKLRRSECRRQYLEGEFDFIGRVRAPGAPASTVLLESSACNVEPHSDLRASVTRIVAATLGIPAVPASIALNSLGLDSLRAAQLTQALAQEFDADIDLAELFHEASVDWLVNRLTAEGQDQARPFVRGPQQITHPKSIDPFPLTDMQQAYWLGRASAYDLGGVSLHGYVEIEAEDLDVDRLERAIQLLVDRHEMLRAILLPDGQQRVLESVPLYRIERVDLSNDTSGREFASLREKMSHEVIPIEQWPPFRVLAVVLPNRKLGLIASIDGMFMDFRSGQVLVHELLRLYSDPTAARELPSPGFQFRDYVLSQIAAQKEPGFTRSLAFWLDRIEHLPAPPDLPTKRELGTLRSQRIRALSFHLSGKRLERLRRRLRVEGVTQAALLLAAYVEVIGTWSRSSHFAINVPILGREGLPRGWNDTIGNFSSFVLLGADVSTSTDLLSRAAGLQRELLIAVKHSAVSGVRVLRELSLRRAQAPGNGMQVVFTHFPGGLDEWDRSLGAMVEGRLGKVTYAVSQTPQVLLDNLIIEQGDGLRVHWEFIEDVFPDGMIEAMFGSYCELLDELADDPDALKRPGRQLLPAGQRRLRDESNRTEVQIADRTLQSMLREQASVRPTETALICPGRRISYAELSARTNAVAWRLREAGLQSGDLVAIAMEKGWEQLAAAYGILAAGGVYVPLDPSAPDERLRQIVESSGVRLITTQAHLWERLNGIFAQVRPIMRVDENGDGIDAAFPDAAQSPTDPAYVLYTSGSTGSPKGVVVSHRAVVNMLDCTNRRLGVGPSDVVLSLTAMHHDLSVYDMFGLISAGGAIVLPNPKLMREPGHWLELIVRECVTIWNSVPALMSMLLAYSDGVTSVKLNSLRQIILGGDWIPLDVFKRLRTLTDARLLSIGGPTETTVWNIWYPVETIDPEWRSIPYGLPIDNTKYFVLDDQLRDRPIWIAGELYCAGTCLANGYLNDPEANAAKFVAHPRTGERIYRTGDIGRYLPDGNIEFLGRADFQVKIQGNRIEPGEIEFAIKAHPVVDAAVVVACGTKHQQVLAAYVVPRGEGRISHDALQAALHTHLTERLPAQMIPPRIQIVPALPLSALGKVDRLALSKMGAQTMTDQSGRPPQSRTERRLAALLTEILGLDRVDVERNLFELGANSLHIVQLQGRILKLFDKSISVTQIFRHPTVRSLAETLDAGSNTSIDVRIGRERARRRLQSRGMAGQGAIAITGIGCRFPGANDARQFWANLSAGVESIEQLSLEELVALGVDPKFAAGPDYVRAASVLRDVMMFDPEFFAMTPREAALTDPQQRLLLECAYDALCDSGHAPQSFPGSIGVFVGCGYGTYLVNNLTSEFDVVNFDAAQSLPVLIGNDKDYAATRVSYKLDLRGPSVSLGTACSSSLLAVHEACQKLLAGECDLALAGGAKVSTPDRVGYRYQEGGVQSSDGHCRPFDASATGTVFGSGVGVVVLRRLEEALEDGDSIYAVIRGGAVNNDGATKVSYTAPSVQGQVQVIAEAHAVAGISSRTVTYVEAHGTGTPLGDPIEVASLREAFDTHDGTERYCAIGSVKSNLGHLDAAAGIAGLIKTALALHRRKIPPILGFKEPNPQIDLDHGPFYVNTELRDWKNDGDTPLRAGVSSFGIGGTNVHMVLEQPPFSEVKPEPTGPDHSFHALAISARSEAALQQAAENYAAELGTTADNLANFCFTANAGRNHYPYRMAVVADSKAALKEKLQAVGRGVARPFRGLADTPPRIAALYSGQGGQYHGMGRQLFQTQATFRSAMERCDALFRAIGHGRSLLDVIWTGNDAQLLNETRFTQPALFAIQWSMTELLRSIGIQPEFVLGHSIGEYAAACAAGVFDLEDAMRLVAARGQLIDTYCESGAMIAALGPRERIAAIVTGIGPELAIAAENGPASTVLAGTPAAIAAAGEELKNCGVRFEHLAVSHGFHSPLMEPAIEAFSRVARSVSYNTPTCRLISTVKGDEVTDEIADHAYWVDHVRRPVLFGAAVNAAATRGVRTWLEVGVGRSLVTLASNCITGEKLDSERLIGGLRHGRDEWHDLLETVSKLYVAGAPIHWPELDKGQKRRRVRLPSYPYQRMRCLIDPRPARPAASAKPSAERLQITWRSCVAGCGAAPTPGRWLIFVDAGGFGLELATALKDTGASCVLVHAGEKFAAAAGDYVVRASHLDDIAAVLERECRPEESVDAILYAWSLDAKSPTNGMSELADHRALLASQQLLGAARSIAGFDFKVPPKFVLLTRGAEQVLADDPIELGQAPLSAIYKVLAIEHPELAPMQIDIDPKRPPSVAAVLSRLQTMWSSRDQVAERAGTSYLARLLPEASGKRRGPVRLRPDATYWITGGQGAIGLLLARRLAAWGARHIVLTSRDRALQSATEEAIGQLGRDGVDVVLQPGNVADRVDMRNILDEIGRTLPALAGVFHAAGVVQDGMLLTQSHTSFSAVFEPKVAGSWNLHELTREHPLDHFVMFSSSAGLLGSPGQANYAAANAFLDGLAHYRRRLKLPAVSIAWGPWADAGMATSANAHRSVYKRHLLRPLQSGEAFDQLAGILEYSDPCTAVLAMDLEAARQSMGVLFPSDGPQAALLGELLRAEPSIPDRQPGLMRAGTRPGWKTNAFSAMTVRERRPALAAYIGNQLRDMLELGDAVLNPKMPLVDVGLESLTAMSLRNRFSHDLGLKLPVALLYAHPTVEALSEFFERQLFPKEQGQAEAVTLIAAKDRIKTQPSEKTLDELTTQLEDRIGKILGGGAQIANYSK